MKYKKVKCLACPAMFYPYDGRKYCSMRCYSAIRREQKECTNCGKKYEISKSHANRSQSNFYCSEMCYLKRRGVTQVDPKIKFYPIPNFSKYEISTTGLIRNKRTGHIRKPHIDKKEYYFIRIPSDSGKWYNKRIHRLVALTFLKNAGNYPMINHKDGNKSNNTVNNLEWCNNSQNQLHAYQHGLNKGRKHIINHKN